MALIQVVTHEDPFEATEPSTCIWDRDPEIATDWFSTFCTEFPEHLVRLYRGDVDASMSDADITVHVDATFAQAAADGAAPAFGEVLAERAATPIARRARRVTIDLTEEQFAAIQILDSLGSLRASGDDDSVFLISFTDDLLIERLIRADGTYTVMTRDLGTGGWNGVHDTDF